MRSGIGIISLLTLFLVGCVTSRQYPEGEIEYVYVGSREEKSEEEVLPRLEKGKKETLIKQKEKKQSKTVLRKKEAKLTPITKPQVIVVRGQGAVDPNIDHREFAKAQARRAAILDGYRNLLARLYGTDIDSASQDIPVYLEEIQGIIQYVELVNERFDGKIYTVEMMLSQPRS